MDVSARSGGLSGVTGVGRTVLNRIRIAIKDIRDREEQDLSLSPQARQAHLLEFYEKYEETVEVLVDGAQFGPTPELEKRYAGMKAYMAESYPAIRPYVLAYVRLSLEDEEFGLKASGKGCDPFEALTAAPDLATFLQYDDGHMIARIMRTREALTLYSDHLRYLLARSE